MNDTMDWMTGAIDPNLLGGLVTAIRAYQHVAQMQAAIAHNEDEVARLEWVPGDSHAQQARIETLHLHTSIMHEHLERRLEPARQHAVQRLLASLDESGQAAFRATLARLAEPPPPVSACWNVSP